MNSLIVGYGEWISKPIMQDTVVKSRRTNAHTSKHGIAETDPAHRFINGKGVAYFAGITYFLIHGRRLVILPTGLPSENGDKRVARPASRQKRTLR
ncbi:hypothetical protein [Acidithiobacillus sulfuriphilus]|uniref:hypothetical protein n=1 Tax=Acidithiobacillus sulfuriphilus TaxID=1867749 RepID=UPI003F62DBB8